MKKFDLLVVLRFLMYSFDNEQIVRPIKGEYDEGNQLR